MTRSRQQARTIFSSPVQTHQLTNISISLWPETDKTTTVASPRNFEQHQGPFSQYKSFPLHAHQKHPMVANQRQKPESELTQSHTHTHIKHKAKEKTCYHFLTLSQMAAILKASCLLNWLSKKKKVSTKIWVLEEWLGGTWIRRGEGAEAWGRSKLEEDHAEEAR